MADRTPKKPFKSVAGNKPMRSRGFLSAPGGQSAASTADAGNSAEVQTHHRSRGARQVSVSTDGKPRDLSVKPVIRPYTLEDT
ncbi:hypothetical protein [Roseibium sp.]|uniref:hypothetical protein n=1 Tax=Roseibium sp. TaxID=1936156 RepID=UPI003BAEF06A